MMNARATSQPSESVLGIIAGEGDLPARIISRCASQNRPVFCLVFEGTQLAFDIESVPHQVVRFGAIGEAMEALRQAGAGELVMAGRMKRPSLANLRPDATAARLLARLGTGFFTGDDKLLSTIVTFLEEEGFTIIGADEVLGDVLAPEGLIGKAYPDKRSQGDIEQGVKIAKAVGAMDIGQAVIIQRGMILGVEAAEGTDALIERCANLKLDGGGGVLVKVKKPNQERRVDLPTIGVSTIERMHAAGFAGIAIEAGGALIIDAPQVARAADALGLFVVGFTHS